MQPIMALNVDHTKDIVGAFQRCRLYTSKDNMQITLHVYAPWQSIQWFLPK